MAGTVIYSSVRLWRYGCQFLGKSRKIFVWYVFGSVRLDIFHQHDRRLAASWVWKAANRAFLYISHKTADTGFVGTVPRKNTLTLTDFGLG